MVNRYVAYTQPVNPANSTPVLTKAHLWAGLRKKVRHAEAFVPLISSCKVLSDEGNVVTRAVIFDDGIEAEKKSIKEVCREYADVMVHFEQEDGSLVQNIISDGPDGTDSDLHLTYVFELFRPQLAEGSEGDRQLVAQYMKTAKLAVDSTIAVIRKMVVAGEL